MTTKAMKFGLERFVENPSEFVGRSERCALLCNQASVTHELQHAAKLLQDKLGSRLVRLFSPQHGFFGEKQDNMVISDDTCDPLTGLPVVSLYGQTLEPPEVALADIDVLIVDLLDAGTRVYTFITTVIGCLRVASHTNTRVLILDRPNPIGGELIEGPQLDPQCRSFVGQLPVPLRHGLTMAELARCALETLQINVALDIVAIDGWNRPMTWWDDPWEWVMPSPNLPSPLSCLVYPGTVLFEGTNISEGRGTTRPFEIVGAPYVDPIRLIRFLAPFDLPGCRLRPTWFEPTFNKWAGTLCGGVQIHITDRTLFRPVRTAVAILAAVRRLWPDEFRWKEPPYEFDYVRPPIDLIAGTTTLREMVDQETDVRTILECLEADLGPFRETRQRWLLYG